MLCVAFFGAGQVNFGGGEGPWNHAKRLEILDGSLSYNGKSITLNIVGIYDLHVKHAERILERQRKNTLKPAMWSETQVFANYNDMLDSLHIDAVFIGVPPDAHGTSEAPNDIEIQCARRGIHMFIEKPLSCHPMDEVASVASFLSNLNDRLVTSVGYMFRYSKVVKRMKEIISKFGIPRMFMGRYMCAYSNIAKEMWWDTKKSGGPVIEQATHFCDLARFLVGEVDLDSVQANSIKQTDTLGVLSCLPDNIRALEQNMPDDRKTARVTSAQWKFKSGAIGSLTHGVLLHGNKYESEIEIWGDGYRMVLSDPYAKCSLSIRMPGSEETIIEEYSNDDPYLEEDEVFMNAVLNRASTHQIASTYEDAFHTYELSWKIRTQSE